MLKFIGYFLLGLHIGLLAWSAGGMLEWLLPKVPWKPFSNPDFPRWLLFLHWSVIIIASAGFVYGFFSRWKFTPNFMIIAYGFMAIVCVIETFGFMGSKTKYLAMGFEFAAYIIILVIIHQATFKALHFKT